MKKQALDEGINLGCPPTHLELSVLDRFVWPGGLRAISEGSLIFMHRHESSHFSLLQAVIQRSLEVTIPWSIIDPGIPHNSSLSPAAY